MLGANKEKIAKVIRLRVVKNPAAPLDIPKSSRINGISGPTEAMEVRRLIDIKITPRIRRAWEEDLDKVKYDLRNARYEIKANVERRTLTKEWRSGKN